MQMNADDKLIHDHFPVPNIRLSLSEETPEWKACLYPDGMARISRSPSPYSFVDVFHTKEEDESLFDDYECLDVPTLSSTEALSLANSQKESTSTVKSVTVAAVSAVSIVAATALSIQFGPTVSRAVRAGVTGVTDHFKNQNPALLETYYPQKYVFPFLAPPSTPA